MDTDERIQELESEIRRLEKLAYSDELTGALNRRGFLNAVGAEFRLVAQDISTLERRVGVEIPFAVVFLDLDNFKSINDEYGHDAGDSVLKAAVRVLRENLRYGDTVGRWGGEEFVVALVGAGATLSDRIAEKLRGALERTQCEWQGKAIPLTASFGVAVYRGTGSLQTLIDAADKAMYRAKEAGKNCVVVAE